MAWSGTQALGVDFGEATALGGVVFESARSFPGPQIRTMERGREADLTAAPWTWGWWSEAGRRDSRTSGTVEPVAASAARALMPEVGLDQPQVHAVVEQGGRAGVAQGLGVRPLADARPQAFHGTPTGASAARVR
jgi:hypothetical protein